MTRRIIKKIFQKNRLAEYENILIYALEKGYTICSLREWYNHLRSSGNKVFILRHDVDLDPKGAWQFFETEKKLGVKSTYYFRWKTMVPHIMKEMHDNDFEVSLHFETLADYARQHKIRSKKEITEEVIQVCRDNLSDEVRRFEKKFFKIHTLCSHGDRRNRLLGIPNHVLTDEAWLEKHHILFEVYQEKITSSFDAYISDSSIYSDFRWQHYGSPYKAMDKGEKTICLLTHPVHWNQGFLKNIGMLIKIYRDNK